MYTSQNQPAQYPAFQAQSNSASNSGVAPQSFDFSSILSTVAQSAAQALPGLLMSLLSADPQIQQLQQSQQASRQQGGVNPQGLFNIGARTPFGGGGLGMFDSNPQLGQQQYGQQYGQQQAGTMSPQGFDFGSILSTVAQSAAQALPGLLMSLLSANPQIQQIQQASRQQQGGVNPQGLFNIGLNTPFGGAGLSIFDSSPQIGGELSPQFNFGSVLKSVASRAAQALPGLLIGLLSADPQIQQIQRSAQQSQGGVNPQGLFNFGVQQQGNALSPQGLDLRAIAQNVAGLLAPQIPAIVNSILGQVLGTQQQQATLH